MADETSPTGDELIAKSEQATLDADRARRAANLFDLRKIIAGLFLVYGVILTIAGITDSKAEVHKAADIRINLWVGLAMLAVSALFIAWALWRPLGEQIVDEEESAAGA